MVVDAKPPTPQPTLMLTSLLPQDADWAYSTYNYSHPILTERLKAIGWKGSDRKISADAPASASGEQHQEL